MMQTHPAVISLSPFPDVSNIEPTDRPAKRGSRLAQILCAVTQPEDYSEVTPTFDALALHEHFEQPHYSAARLYTKNLFLTVRDAAARRCRDAVSATRTVRTWFGDAKVRVADLRTSTPEEINQFSNAKAREVGLSENWRESVLAPEKREESLKVWVEWIETEKLKRKEPKFTSYDPAWDVLRKKALEAHYAGNLNFCPRCWVARLREISISKERACLDCKGLAKLDEVEAESREACKGPRRRVRGVEGPQRAQAT